MQMKSEILSHLLVVLEWALFGAAAIGIVVVFQMALKG